MSVVKAIATSPVVLIIAEHFYERWIYSAIFEAVETFMIRPDNADIESPDAISRDRATSILGLHRRSPTLVRKKIKKLLILLGWCEPTTSNELGQEPSLESASSVGQSITVGGTQLANLIPLEIPVSRTDRSETDDASGNVVSVPVETIDDLLRPTIPPIPTALEHTDSDPRIRITSREGIVEMEVRLPPRVISSHTEVLDGQITSSAHDHDLTAPRTNSRQPASRPYHRVTQLSTEPSQMIGAIVKAQLVGFAILPFKLAVLRLVASHYLARQSHHSVTPRFVEPFTSSNDLQLYSIGTGISRVALCTALELAVDLSLWCAQYLAVTTIGKSFFGWGTL